MAIPTFGSLLRCSSFPWPRRTFLPILATLISTAGGSALALTVPVAQDASSTAANTITPATGKATSLAVNAKQTAFVRFNVSNLAVVPAEITAANITSATLRLYVTGTKPGDLTVHAVTSDWSEVPAGKSAPIPTIDPTVLVTIPGTDTVGKHFITVDVTAQVKSWLATPASDFGLAIQTTTTTAKVRLGSKEGPGLGEAVELEIQADLFGLAPGGANVDGPLKVSTSFIVESRPNSTGGLNNFIGAFAGESNTSGLGNTFVGHNSGKDNVSGSSNSFFGLNAGAGNTTGGLNVFLGQGAGAFNDSGSNNTFAGQAAGFNNTTGGSNSFFGWHAGFSNGSANGNAFFGDQAGALNTVSNNAFFGAGAGATNVVGTQDCYFGINAGNKATGSFNSFFGAGAGQNTSTGVGNTFLGNIAGIGNTLGSSNTYLGGNTGGSSTNESRNTLIGDSADIAAGVTNSAALGANAKVTASNSLVLGSISGVNGAAANTNVGIGVTAPHSTLQVGGSVAVRFRASAAAINVLNETDCIFVFTGTTASSGVNLPTAVGAAGRLYYVKNRGTVAFGIFTIQNQGIDGTNYTVSPLNVAVGSVVQLVSDGANWLKMN